MVKILVVVDYQKDFVDGALPCGPHAKEIENNIVELVTKRQAEGYEVFATLDTHDEDNFKETCEGKLFPNHCFFGTDGHKLYGKVADLDMTKVHKTAPMFNDWGFLLYDQIVEQLNDPRKLDIITDIELCGLDLTVCLFQNALALRNLCRFANVRVNLAASATFDEKTAEFCKAYMKSQGIELVEVI